MFFFAFFCHYTEAVGTPSHWAPEMIPESSDSMEVTRGYGKEVDL